MAEPTNAVRIASKGLLGLGLPHEIMGKLGLKKMGRGQSYMGNLTQADCVKIKDALYEALGTATGAAIRAPYLKAQRYLEGLVW